MAQTLFGSDTPVNTDQNNGSPGITTATRVRFAVAGQFRVRWFCPTTAPAAATWLAVAYNPATDSASGAIGNAVFASLTPGAWNYASTWFSVAAGDEAVVEVWNSEGRYVNTQNYFTTDKVVGDLTGPADDAVTPRRNGRFDVGGAPAFPTSGFAANGYFVDVEFIPDAIQGDSALAAVAALTASGLLTRIGTLSAAGTAALTPAALVERTGAAALAGTGGLTTAGLIQRIGAAGLSAAADLTAAAELARLGAADLAGAGGLTTAAIAERIAAAALAGTGSLAGDGLVARIGAATLTGVAGLSAIASVEPVGAAQLLAVADLAAAAAVQMAAALPLATSAGLTAVASVTGSGAVIVRPDAGMVERPDLGVVLRP